jgi:Cu/Ag efflux protein CusF
MLQYIHEWCLCEDVNECKLILQKLGEEKEIFLGEFVKAILKINNISCEMEKIAEMVGNIALLDKLKEVSKMTMKFVVTNQSLYV